ncbi:MAG: hypothetical protein WBQ43_07315 [Terriglobales bacterium]
MKSIMFLTFLLSCMSLTFAAPIGAYQHGTVTRMHMGDCQLIHRGFMNQFGPPQQMAIEDSCPEYTLVTEKVVFLIVGKSSSQLVPLAEVIDFRFQNKDLAIRVDDARKESKFTIKEMTLRSQWELLQKHIEQELTEPPREPVDTSLTLRSRR